MQLDAQWLCRQGQDAVLLRAIDAALSGAPHKRIGVAVSGGGDSMALLHLLARWTRQTGAQLHAVTVDHGLRPESAQEADFVAARCRALSRCQSFPLRHDTLRWHDNSPNGNLPAAARAARYALMAQWARARDLDGIMLGHTLDDNAENFLIRLGRAAGVDGLAGMQVSFERDGVRWGRPLLDQSRAALRQYLRRHDVAWVEDPSNEDMRYTRTKARKALAGLEKIGVEARSIHRSAVSLRMARGALDHYTHQEAQTHVTQIAGDLCLPEHPCPAIPPEIERRLWMAALWWVKGGPYAPRGHVLPSLAEALKGGGQHTSAGCHVTLRAGCFRITREHNAVKDLCTPSDAIWDGRWRLEGPHAPDLEIRALGRGIHDIPNWRESRQPRSTLLASPAVWRGETLIAAPLAGFNPLWTARIVADFTSFLLSH